MQRSPSPRSLKEILTAEDEAADLRLKMMAVLAKTPVEVEALLLDLLITVALYLSLQHLVLKPLRQVERYAGEVALGRIAAPEYSQLELLGELNRLTASIDTLLRQLGQRNIELTKSSEHFKTVIRLLPIPLILYDDDETNLYVNERFVATFGYTLSDIPDSASWYKLAYPDPAYRKEVNSTTSLRNNILFNARTNSGGTTSVYP